MKQSCLREPLWAILGVSAVLLLGACGHGPTSVSISPSSVTLNAGDSASFTVTAAGTATCSATGGTLTQSGNTLTFVAPAVSASFTITCEYDGRSVTATAVVSGPIVIEYIGAVPQHATAPQGLPIFWIYRPNLASAIGCHAPTWLGGNHWRCDFPLVPPATILVRVHDPHRNAIQPVTSGFYCEVIRFNGVEAIPQPDEESGCIARFR